MISDSGSSHAEAQSEATQLSSISEIDGSLEEDVSKETLHSVQLVEIFEPPPLAIEEEGEEAVEVTAEPFSQEEKKEEAQELEGGREEAARIPAASLFSKEVERGVLVANTAWFLDSPVHGEDLESCVRAVDYWDQLSKTQISLQPEQWVLAARAILVLLKTEKYQQSPELLQGAADLLLRFYICHNRPSRLPPELFALSQRLSQTTDLQERCFFVRSMARCTPTLEDPNGVACLKIIDEEHRASRWRTCDLQLKGVSKDKPWAGQTDRKAILGLLHHLSSSCSSVELLSRPENLDNLCVCLLFILSAHSLYDQEWAESKAYFRTLLPLLEPLLQHLGQIDQMSDEDRQRANNFRMLFFFMQGTNFVHRMDHEREPSGGFSIWGQRQGTSALVGNTKDTFTISDLHSALSEAREVAKRDRRKLTPQRPVDLFQVEPLPLIPPPRGGIVPQWERIFFEGSAESLASSWSDRQDAARHAAADIVEAFHDVLPPIDFLALVRAVQEGSGTVNSYLASMEDQGLTLLKEYVYPFIVLTRLAQTDQEALCAKFIAGAASADEICSLGGEDRAVQIAVLKNVVRLMRPQTQGDVGGGLATSAIHASQVSMLRTMVSSIETGKQVYICNETGSGKTTMAKIAAQIVSFQVPMVLHVAPFTQAEKGWKRLTQWSDLDGVEEQQTPHFWITAADLSDLMRKGVPERYKTILQKSFLLMDEYDSEAYRYVVQKASGDTEMSSVQDELVFSLGAQRLCNMSATPNLETFKNKIERYQKKLEEVSSLPEKVREERAAYYRTQIGELTARRDELLRSMTREWARSMTIVPIASESDPQAQIEQVFTHLRSEPFGQERRGSVLVEMPRFVLTPPFVDSLHDQMQSLFPTGPAAILFRDSNGSVQAHLFGPPWTQMSLEEFTDRYPSFDSAPPTVCFYAQDSVGGDFGLFSNERFVRSQHILYPGSVAPSYAFFQNLRRQRVNRGAPAAGEALVPSRTPATMYLGVEAEASLHLTLEEEQGLALLPGTEHSARLDELRKQKLIVQADATALHFYRQMESSRIKLKTIRKKQQMLSEILEMDRIALMGVLEKLQLPVDSAELLTKQINQLFSEARANSVVGFEEDVKEARKRIHSSITEQLTVLQTNPLFRASELEWHEAVLGLHALFPPTIPSADPWDYIVKCLKNAYSKQTSPVDVLLDPVQQWSERQANRMLHPIPSRKAVEEALKRVRLRSKILPAVDAYIEVPPERPGVPLLPPTDMIKAIVGAQTRDLKAAQRFLDRLAVAKEESVAFQDKHVKYLKEFAEQGQQIKEWLREYIDALGTDRPGVFMSEEEALAQSPRVKALARKSEEYKRKHEEYTGR